MIRKANISDLDSILSMAKNFVNEVELLMGYNENDTRESFLAMVDNPNTVILISEDNKAMLVGAIAPWMCNKKAKTAIEMAWYVDPSVRRSYVGRDLIITFEQWAKSQGCTFVSMGSLKSSKMNELSAFYEKCGYQLHENTYVRAI